MANSDERRRLGSWYTPPALIEKMLNLLTSDGWPIGPTSDEMRILDPSCGDGRLLLAVRQRLPRRCLLVGCDINPQTRESNEEYGIEFVEANGLDIDWTGFHGEHGFDLDYFKPAISVAAIGVNVSQECKQAGWQLTQIAQWNSALLVSEHFVQVAALPSCCLNQCSPHEIPLS